MTNSIKIAKIKLNSKKIESILLIVFPVLIVMMSITRNGNLNLLYFSSILILIYEIIVGKVRVKNILIHFVPFLAIAVLTYAFSPYFNNYEKTIIYLMKLFLCVNLYIFVKNANCSETFVSKILDNISIIIFVLTVVAIITQNDYLWRFNDTINSYSTTRLQLLFQEPSELSEVCGILLICRFYRIRKSAMLTIKDCLFLIMITIPLLLSAGLSGIVYSAIAVILFTFLSEIKYAKKGNVSFYFLVLILFAICLSFSLLFINSNIINRISAVLNGQDGSFNYRYVRAVDALGYILVDTKGIGVGLGNLRTDAVGDLLENFGLMSFSNSYLFFIAEGGILSLFYLSILILTGIKRVLKAKIDFFNKCFRISLIVFLIIIQITGGYFTDPFLWLATGLAFGINVGR